MALALIREGDFDRFPQKEMLGEFASDTAITVPFFSRFGVRFIPASERAQHGSNRVSQNLHMRLLTGGSDSRIGHASQVRLCRKSANAGNRNEQLDFLVPRRSESCAA